MKRDTSKGLGGPFNRWNGRFRNNIRSETGDLGELKESMRAHGWREHLPAIEDENHVILTGHRRLLVCEELNAEGLDVKPVIYRRHFGSGKDATCTAREWSIARFAEKLIEAALGEGQYGT